MGHCVGGRGSEWVSHGAGGGSRQRMGHSAGTDTGGTWS